MEEREKDPSNRPNLILWDKLITMTDEGLFASPQRKKSDGGQKKKKVRTTNIADLLAQEDKGKAASIEVKKHIVRYNRFPTKPATPGPSAPARAPSATLIHAAMTEAPDEPVFERPIVSSDQLDSAPVLKWSCHSRRASLSVRRHALGDWCYPSPPLPFAAGGEEGEQGGLVAVLREGTADLKCWWRSDSNGAQAYIFIILQSAPKTLSLVFKVSDGPTAAGARLPTWCYSFQRLPAGGCVGRLSADPRWLLKLRALEQHWQNRCNSCCFVMRQRISKN